MTTLENPVAEDTFETRAKRIDTAQRGAISFDQYVAFTQQRATQQAEEVQKIGAWH